MRDIVITDYCDFCHQIEGRKEEAVGSFVTGLAAGDRGNPTLHILMACEGHMVSVEQFKAVLENCIRVDGQLPHRTKPKAVRPELAPGGDATPVTIRANRPPSQQTQTCPLCPLTTSSRNSLAAHIWHKHRPGEERPQPSSTTCPECGYINPTGKPQGISSHRRIQHQYDIVKEALDGIPKPRRMASV